MRSEYNPREAYTGDGIQSEFTFDFKIQNLDHLLVVLVDDEGEQIWQKRGSDTSEFSTTLNPDGEGGRINWNFMAPPTDWKLILLLADDAPTQPSRYTADGRYTSKKMESSLDTLSGQIQRIRYLLDRSLRLPEAYSDAFVTELANLIPEAVPMVNDTGTAFVMVPRTDFKGDPGEDALAPNFYFSPDEPDSGIGDSGDIWIVSTTGELFKYISGTWESQGFISGGVQPDSKAFSVLESVEDPMNIGTFSAEWSNALVFKGYSARFNQVLNLEGVHAAMAWLFDIQYSPPTVSFTASGSGTIREKGTAVTSTTLNVAVGFLSENITEVRFYLSPSTLLDTQTSGGAIPGGGNNSYNWTGSFTDTTSFIAHVDDASPNAKPTVTRTVTFTFVYPYFWGSGAAGLTAAQIASTKTKDVRVSQDNITRTFPVAGGNYFYFAQPSSYPAITKIFDANNFEVQGGFTSFTGTYTALDGSTQTLRVYVNTAPIGVDTLLRYVR